MTGHWWTTALLAALLAATASATSQRMSWREDAALRDSLSRVHPRFRASWLKERGIQDEYWQGCIKPADSGLRVVGRWSLGPSYDVDGRVTPTETLVVLARGSGVSLIRFARTDSVELELLADVNAGGLMKRVAVRESLLYVGSTAGLEIWDIADERNPRQLSWLHTALNDFDVQDSFAYVIGPDDSFKVYNVSNAANPVFRGACRDSGDLVSAANNAAFIGDRWGLYVVDVSNPAAPRRIGSWGSAIEQVLARGSLCYVTTFNPNQPGEITFHILDASTPASPVQIGVLNQTGGNDVHLVDTLAFCSGESDFNQFTIVSVADSTRPQLIGSAGRPGWGMGIWSSGPAHAAFVGCHWVGLQVYDARNTAQPVRDTGLLGADMAVDVYVDAGKAYVADYRSSLQILDVTDPTSPVRLGGYRSGDVRSAVARDSFAFISWPRPRMLTIDVSEPAQPESAGACDGMFNWPEDMVIRDSFVYCAEASRFQVVNVARPRQPVLVGSCVTGVYSGDLELPDTFAYLSGASLKIVNTARPDSPYVAGSYGRGVSGLCIVDTLLYAVGQYAQFWALSIANPVAPRPLDSVTLPSYDGEDVVVIGTTAYASENVIRTVDVSDPSNLRITGQVSVPYWTPRLVYAEPYLYACCAEGGICIFETVPAGVAEPAPIRLNDRHLSLFPSMTDGRLAAEARGSSQGSELTVFDMTGKEVLRLQVPNQRHGLTERWLVDLTRLPSGIYVVRLHGCGVSQIGKVVLTRR